MFALVHAAAFDQIISIRGKPSLESALLNQLSESGFGADRGFVTFSIRLPETDIVCKLICVVVEALFPFLGAPDPDAIFHKPFYNKGRFVCNAPNPVKHEHQEDIKLALTGVFLDDYPGSACGGPESPAGRAVFRPGRHAGGECSGYTGWP